MKKIKHLLLVYLSKHTSVHGVLRLILELDGEIIVKADPHIGLLHRGTEKGMCYFKLLWSLIFVLVFIITIYSCMDVHPLCALDVSSSKLTLFEFVKPFNDSKLSAEAKEIDTIMLRFYTMEEYVCRPNASLSLSEITSLESECTEDLRVLRRLKYNYAEFDIELFRIIDKRINYIIFKGEHIMDILAKMKK